MVSGGKILVGMAFGTRGGRAAIGAVLLAGSTLAGFASPAWGQSAEAAARSFNIPSQPLADAIMAYGSQSGIQVTAAADLVAGRTSSAVSGTFEPAAALSQMLAGTELTFRFIRSNVVALERAPQAARSGGTITLGPVRVQGEGSGRSGGTGTVRPPADTSGTYTVGATSSATRLDLTIKDTPQVVNVITRQRIEDQNLVQVADVLAQAPGVTVQQQGVPGMGQMDYWSRGFTVTNVMFDGATTPAAGNGDFVLWSALDTAIFDRVEFVQGSTGLSSGVGDPSASVNFVRKRPTEERQGEAFVSYGSWDRRRITLDLSGRLNSSGSLRARVVGAHQAGGTWQDRVKFRSNTLYGIVEAEPSDALLLTAGMTWADIRVDDAAPFGLRASVPTNGGGSNDPDNYVSIKDFGRSYNPATQWSFAKIRLLNPFAKMEWHIADGWRINASYMFSDVRQQRLMGTMGQNLYDKARDHADYAWANFQNKGQIHNGDISVNGKFHALGREHDLVVGLTGYKGHLIDRSGASNTSILADVYQIGCGGLRISEWNNGDVPFPTCGPAEAMPGLPNFMTYDPLFGANWPHELAPDNRIDEEQYAPYFALRLRPLERLQLILGGRQNSWNRRHVAYSLDMNHLLMSYLSTGTPEWTWQLGNGIDPDFGSYDFKVKGRFTPYAGAILAVTDSVTTYLSYTGISKQNTLRRYDGTQFWAMDENGDPLPAISGNSWELGAKAGLFDDRMNIQLAGYRMKQENVPVTWGSYYVAGGGVVSEGVEFSLSGQITPRLNLSLGYSLLNLNFDSLKPGTWDPSSGQWSVDQDNSSYCVSTYSRNGDRYPSQNPDENLSTRDFNCPKHTLKIFGTWQATDRLTVGGGLNWKSATGPTGNFDRVQVESRSQGSFAVVDLSARYQLHPRLRVAAFVGNVFDKKYLTTQDLFSGYYGAPRNVTVSLTGQF